MLLCGAVHGQLRGLAEAVERAEAKAGQFEAVFAVGPLFPGAAENDDAWEALRAAQFGERVVRPHIYALDVLPEGASAAPEPSGDAGAVPLAKGITWLRGGGLELLAGLSVAWLSGKFHYATWTEGESAPRWAARRAGETWPGDFHTLQQSINAASSPPDLLLTSEWPEGVNAADPHPPAPSSAPVGTPAPHDACLLASPRYHAAPGPLFHNRSPFCSSRGHATRFVSLAPLHTNHKFLHALKLVPIAEAQPPAPAILYPNPFLQADAEMNKRKRSENGKSNVAVDGESTGSKISKEGNAGDTKLFLGNVPFKATEGEIANALDAALGVQVSAVIIGTKENGKPAGYAFVHLLPQQAKMALSQGSLNMHGREVRIDNPRVKPKGDAGAQPVIPEAAVEGCWFCLENDKDTHLVASVGEETFIAADKAQLTEHHALCLPISHAPSLASLPISTLNEIWAYVCAMSRCFQQELGMRMVAFERHLRLKSRGGNHCHVNCLPFPENRAPWLESVLIEEAQCRGFELTDLGHVGSKPGEEGARALQSALRESAGRGEYFVALLPDGKCLAHLVGQGERHPVGFGREALGKALGKESRAHWRSLVEGEREGEEQSAAEKLRSLFASYDPLMQHER